MGIGIGAVAKRIMSPIRSRIRSRPYSRPAVFSYSSPPTRKIAPIRVRAERVGEDTQDGCQAPVPSALTRTAGRVGADE